MSDAHGPIPPRSSIVWDDSFFCHVALSQRTLGGAADSKDRDFCFADFEHNAIEPPTPGLEKDLSKFSPQPRCFRRFRLGFRRSPDLIDGAAEGEIPTDGALNRAANQPVEDVIDVGFGTPRDATAATHGFAGML
jgi:hypothetical protein